MQVGFDGRNGYNYVKIHSSNIPEGTNVDIPGRWVLQASTYPGNKV